MPFIECERLQEKKNGGESCIDAENNIVAVRWKDNAVITLFSN